MDKLPCGTFGDEDKLIYKTKHTKLPICEYKDKIIELIKNNQIVIIQGQTGCGKTTQIPQFILEAGLNDNNTIGVTQSRRISAVSMAKRVAEEKECQLGNEVGYEIRFEKKCTGSSKIKYMTDGILLNECVTDKELKDYSVIMIDEAHERSASSDILLGLLKNISKLRNDLKIIIASATICTEKFSLFFDSAPILTIEGRLFPIEVVYEGYQTDYIRQSVKLIRKIHLANEPGDILLFLTGEEEINDCCKYLKNIENLIVRPLYGAVDFQSQQEVFNAVSLGERKVVVATNIAETSITIDGIRYVIDCGYVKQIQFFSKREIENLEAVKISKAQAEQRKGRAGRTSRGWCHRLYTEQMYNNFIEEAVPEIKRINFLENYLRIIELGYNPRQFEYIERPLEEELARSERDLLELKIINNDGELGPFGISAIGLPVEPRLSKVMITSLNNKCTSDIIKILSMLSEKFIFRQSRNENPFDNLRNPFHDRDGDHFTLLKVFNEFLNEKKKKQWCISNLINYNSMNAAFNIYNQLSKIMQKISPFQDTSSEREAIKKSIISGFFKNICVKMNRDSYMRLYGREVVYIHPQSILHSSLPQIVLFNEVRRTKKAYMHGVLNLDENIIKGFPNELKIIDYPDKLESLSKFT